MKTLKDCRVELDKIDDEILELLGRRAKIVQKVAEIKHAEGESVYKPQREKEILTRLKSQNKLDDTAVDAIFSEIIAVFRSLERPEKIAFLGPEGTNTHQAARKKFGNGVSYLPLSSIEAVFEVVKNKEVGYGVVPIENNTDGVVGVTLDCLGRYDEIKIIAELHLDVHHSLATNLGDTKKITRIYSHPQGYNQCRKFLESHLLMDVEFVPTKSTAEAAKLAGKDPTGAAICPEMAAKLYELPILFNKIEDSAANKTRFFVLGDAKVENSTESYKTSVLAKVENRPGALVELLQSFQDKNINITKIESRPLKEESFEYVFYLDFEGHIDDENVQQIMQKGRGAHQIKWLGSYIKEV